MQNPTISFLQLTDPYKYLGRVGLVLVSLIAGQWFLSEVFQLPGSGLAVVFLGAGVWFFSKPMKVGFQSPSSVQGWVRRCREVLDQFEKLEEADLSLRKRTKRVNDLERILDRSEPQSIAFVGAKGCKYPEKKKVETAFQGAHPLNLVWSSALPLKDKAWNWPNALYQQDLLVYALPLPLRAADLLWLEKVPADQNAWIMVFWPEKNSWKGELKALNAQLPTRWLNKVIRWSGEEQDMNHLLSPIKRILEQPKRNIEKTRLRLLSQLHTSWQADLECLRRQKFNEVQQRTQWIVAGAVFASPVPTTDLLALAVVNGLMIQEMANIWSCSWRPETLQVVARQLAGAALAQGVVEWSGHALLSVAKLHGSSWLAAGTFQALSAAYLTRVVGRSMSDWLAINNGVAEPDLEALKQQASKLVSDAAAQEKMDWSVFLKQAKGWMEDRTIEPNLEASFLDAC